MSQTATTPKVVSILFCGVGGQGVLLSSDITSEAAFLTGIDVKKSEIHGMSQRGGSVTSCVRFGEKVHSPLAAQGTIDYLVAFHDIERDRWKHLLAPEGKVVEADKALLESLPHPRTLNVALLGVLSREISFSDEIWAKAMENLIKPQYLEMNRSAFALGREA